ncbi:phosphoribosylformylglycinamidine synthase subunit PurL [Salinirubrum litoreum]|uniref:Phosphoribosylformylglycinamidine synthase subunit PurL n=1 Tax=Salinirubrum litoreum TaxID=1126234 RepID=A0ABD5R9P7_9EURY|nr:phosphoribosylformylglycinamidine synthase subunit PurL [Salinirubrum litoreum]
MSLPEQDHSLVVAELGRDPTPAESALFENLWSEHCAYRSSRPLLSAFDSEGEQVVVGPGDDAAVVRVPEHAATGTEASDTYLTFGIESHNHPSYVDPFDGAATGVGGIVRDTLSMGAYPIALLDSLYFGDFGDEHARYLFEGVVEGISHYGNCIGVPTVGGSVAFHDDYEGNPLVNVACVGLLSPDRLVTAEAQRAGNKLVLVGNATGRDGLGGASFASEDLAEDAETEDRPAVQVGDPYTEKLLIEANEQLVDEGLIQSARDLGAAGLGGASAELVAKGGFGAEIDLDRVHQREPNMNALEILLAESQERMCYEVRPEDVDRVAAIAERFDLGCSVIGEVTEGNYVCTFAGERANGEESDVDREVVVDVPAAFLGDGAPMNDLDSVAPQQPARDYPAPASEGLAASLRSVIADPSTASKRWVYRQYDHEVGTRTSVLPGDDAAVLALRETERDGDSETGTGLALSSGAEPNWTSVAPFEGARAIALENATNLAVKGATPLAAVDCLNGGNPENPEVYGGFEGIVDGLAEMCRTLSVPVVGGNVSLYNDSVAGPIPPTPTLAMLGTKAGYDAPPAELSGEGELLLVGGVEPGAVSEDAPEDASPHALGGSVYLSQVGGTDRFPALPADPAPFVEVLSTVADAETTLATHDVSHGGLAVTLAEMVGEAGASVSVADERALFSEAPGRAVIETTDPEAVRDAFSGVAPVRSLGTADDSGTVTISVDDPVVDVSLDADEIAALRATITDALD